MMTMYQSLLMAIVSLPFCVLEIWGLKKYSLKRAFYYAPRPLIDRAPPESRNIQS